MVAPIALFAFRRPVHLARTIETLKANPEAGKSALYVFCDSGRQPSDLENVASVRAIVHSIRGFSEVNVTLRETNYGLSRNIIQGVSQVLKEHTQLIVLEDDLVLSPHFLKYMNQALLLYGDRAHVGNITGYCYPSKRPLPESFFVRGPQSWSWATWRDRWVNFNPDGEFLLRELRRRRLEREFNFDDTTDYIGMLEDQIRGRNDSWAVRWYATCFLSGLLTLYPGRSLVHNIGRDGSGAHEGRDNLHDVPLGQTPISLGNIEVIESKPGREAFRDFFQRVKRRNARRAHLWNRTKLLRKWYRVVVPRPIA
jgi:Glycosyl transferase family 2